MSGYQYTGVAPKSRIISVKVLDRKGNGNVSDVLWGLDWIIKNRKQYNIRIINISVGMTAKNTNDEKMKALLDGVEYAWDRGFVVVTAAGNNGPNERTITIPGISKSVITVGSSDEGKADSNPNAKHRSYSSCGPTPFCVCKPEIVTPGSNIAACSYLWSKYKNRYYCKKSGTSMSTPVVSGAVALLLSKYPDMTNLEVKMRMKETSDNLNLPRNRQGWGMLNVERLLY